MKRMILVPVVLVLVFPFLNAQRRQMSQLKREFKPGISEVQVPNNKRMDGFDVITKQNEIAYDSKLEVYKYTYWRINGERVEVFYEPSNLVNSIVSCSVSFVDQNKLYEYRYRVDVSPESKQPMLLFAVDCDYTIITDWIAPDEWTGWKSKIDRPATAKRWVAFASHGHPIPPGGSVEFILYSQEGPIPLDCFGKGLAKNYPHPDGAIDELCVPPAFIEGLRGVTVGPGVIDKTKSLREHLVRDLQIAEEWGWADAEAVRQISKILEGKADLSKYDFSDLREKCKALANSGKIQPEVSAMVEYLLAQY